MFTFLQSVSVSLFMYQDTQAKKNPHLEYTIACKQSTAHRETTKEGNAHRVMATLFHTFLLYEVVHSVSFEVLKEDDIRSTDALYVHSSINIQQSKALKQSHFLAAAKTV